MLRQAQPMLERAAGGPVIGSVSVRNDPMDAVEETIFSEPIDEIMLSVAPHGLSTRLHQDLPHRLGTSASRSPSCAGSVVTRPAAVAWSRCASGRSRVAR